MTLCDVFLKDLHQSLTPIPEQNKKIGSPNSSSNTMLIIEKLIAAQISIVCKQCDNKGIEGNARAYLTDKPMSIVLCSNRLLDEKSLQQALTHEATHAFDFIHKRCDFYSCDGLAYSEVRAARNAECALSWPPFLRKYCVIKHAVSATDNIFPNQGEDCVKRVFHHAYKDVEPS